MSDFDGSKLTLWTECHPTACSSWWQRVAWSCPVDVSHRNLPGGTSSCRVQLRRIRRGSSRWSRVSGRTCLPSIPEYESPVRREGIKDDETGLEDRTNHLSHGYPQDARVENTGGRVGAHLAQKLESGVPPDRVLLYLLSKTRKTDIREKILLGDGEARPIGNTFIDLENFLRGTC